MKEKELREHAICSICEKKIGETGVPLFWTVQIKRFRIKLDVVKMQQGLAMMLGGRALLAQAMGPDEDMAESINTVTLTVCEGCAVMRDLPIAALSEMKEG